MEIRLTGMTIKEIEAVLDKYPWFTLARREIFLKMAQMGEDHKRMGIRRVAGYVYSRERLLKDIKPPGRVETELSEGIIQCDNIFELDFEEIKKSDKKEKEVFVVGGDYFKKEDFESLSKEVFNLEEKLSPIKIKVEKSEITGENSPVENNGGKFGEIDDDDLFYTESLAKVYAAQGFYKRAIDIYTKLILLYPEKNIYFASLIEEIKKKT